MTEIAMEPAVLEVEYCGEWYTADPDGTLVLGRGGDIELDDNPYLHRRFLEVSYSGNFWWLSNVGALLSATLSDEFGRAQAWLAPGARMPIVFRQTVVRFSAGPTAYEVNLYLRTAPFELQAQPVISSDGATTLGRVQLTIDQRLLVLALAERALRRSGSGAVELPSSADAAKRLGWTMTKFNRKLDNVCEKLTKAGVRGLHGQTGKLASQRRARLVEYALAVQLVTVADLLLLDAPGRDIDEVPVSSRLFD